MTATPTPRPVHVRAVHAKRLRAGPPAAPRARRVGAVRKQHVADHVARQRVDQAADHTADGRRAGRPAARGPNDGDRPTPTGSRRCRRARRDPRRARRPSARRSIVLAEDLIAVRGQALAQRGRLPGRTRMMTRCGAGVLSIERLPQRSHRAVRRDAAATRRSAARPGRRQQPAPRGSLRVRGGAFDRTRLIWSLTRIRRSCPETGRRSRVPDS